MAVKTLLLPPGTLPLIGGSCAILTAKWMEHRGGELASPMRTDTLQTYNHLVILQKVATVPPPFNRLAFDSPRGGEVGKNPPK